MLDLSFVFDIIDHPIHVHRLHADFGFTDTVLQWYSCCLSDHTHYVYLSNHCPAFAPVLSGVHRGSVIGPIHITMYINLLFVDSHTIIRNSFADDIQLLMSALPGNLSELPHSIQSCIGDVKASATANILKHK